MTIRVPQPVWEGEGGGGGVVVPPNPNPPANPETPPANPPGPTNLPENWRQFFAPAGDADVLKELERFTDPTKIGSTLLNYKKQMRSGSFTAEAAPDGEKDPDGLKRWREERGIPATVEGYKIDEPVLKKFTDADKPLMTSFLEQAHKAHMPPVFVNFAMKWYTELQDTVTANEQAADRAALEEAEDVLRGEWGPDFRNNMTLAKRAATELGGDINWLEARLPDGRLLGSSAEAIKAFAEYGRYKYGNGPLLDEKDIEKAASRKKFIEDIIAFKPEEYTPALQKEYFEILQAEESRPKRP